MKLISYDTYITIMIGSVALEFIALLFGLVINGDKLSRKKKFLAIYCAIIIYGIISLVSTILYKGIEAFIKNNIFESFEQSYNYIGENVLNHWYNFFLPWIKNDMTNSFFDSTLLIFLWSIATIIGVSFFLFLVILSFSELSEDFFDGILAVLGSGGLAVVTPMTLFHFFNSVYIIFDYSETSSAILFVILFFLIAGIVYISTLSDDTDDTNEE